MGLKTERLTAGEVARAAEILRRGGLVAFATETVYGLGADAANGEAVARIYEAKGRPSFNPLIVHLAEAGAAERFAEVPPLAASLAEAFWPGPLTLLLPLRPGSGLSPLVTAGLETVALRVPAHEGARALLAAFGGPVAAPSANRSGRISPTTAGHVLEELDGRIEAVLDLGPCTVGLESTILAVSGDEVRLARPGGLAVEEIEVVLGRSVEAETTPEKVIAPGQTLAHYAPESPLRLNARAVRPGELLIGFGPTPGAAFSLSERGDLREAAARLFAVLREADARARAEGARLAVAPVPEEGLGRAINDRLRRAAAGAG